MKGLVNTMMTKEMLENNIKQITEAIKVIMEMPAFNYEEARKACNILIKQRDIFKKQLKGM